MLNIKTSFFLLILCLIVLLVSCGSENHGSNNDSKSNTESGANDNSSLNNSSEDFTPVSTGEWKQEQFYLSSCTTPVGLEALRLYREAGFNLCEWAMRSDEDYFTGLKNCNEIEGLYALPSNKFRTSQSDGLVFNEKFIKETVYKYAEIDRNRRLIGYVVWDEPTLSKDFFHNAGRMIEYLDKYDPNSLKFINLFPPLDKERMGADSYEEYVETFIRKINPQVISFDEYPYSYGYKLNETSGWYKDMGLFRMHSLKNNIPFWYYYQVVMLTSEEGEGSKPTNEEIYYQMYVALAYGAKCLIAWNQDAVTSNGVKTEYYEATKLRNAEIMKTGTYLFDKTTTKIYHTGAAGKHPKKFYLDKLSDSKLISSAPKSLIMSVFTDGKTDTEYLLVVNMNTDSSVKGDIKFKSAKKISIFNRDTEKEDSIGLGNSISINLKPGGGEIYIIK